MGISADALAVVVPFGLAMWLAAPDNAYDEDQTWFFLYGSVLGLALISLLAIIAGATLASSRSSRPGGVGILLGWVTGLLLAPVLVYVLWSSFISMGFNLG